MPFGQAGKIHCCGKAFDLLGETSDMAILLFDLGPLTPAIYFPVIGSIDPYSNLDFLNPRSRTDIILIGLVNEVELTLSKSDIWIRVTSA